MAERMNTQQSNTQYCVNHRREQRLLSIALGERCESMADSRSLSSETGLWHNTRPLAQSKDAQPWNALMNTDRTQNS